ncbi:HAD hydrolase-like protein [Actinoplanes sp. NBRC 101535]|uniref:HAD hydrolase-like protein n=1 Tax=Actinoplanes sp. NBRC 101535 TaxID=3032196 RepID=UPI0024A44074|nr:HAD hydrolase-like protein [Actinoplanes sp. NBRC 101535]GLY05301.1 haloacid dehalogenase [Actinoplanes sp. NBRC 101535]
MSTGILMDIDGTLQARGTVIPGAVEAVSELRAGGFRLRLLTNTDAKTPETIRQTLLGYGLKVAADELFTPAVAAQHLCTRPGVRAYTLVAPAIAGMLPAAPAPGPYTHVIVGDCSATLNYTLLDEAFRALRAGATLVALQRGRYYRAADGDHLDTGAIVAALEYAAGVQAEVLGKPSTDFFTMAAGSLGLAPADCLVVGDDATTDIAGGRAAGLRTVQVRTGKYADQQAEALPTVADHTIDSVADLPALLRAPAQ